MSGAQSSKIKNCSVEQQWKVCTSGLVTHRLTNLQTSRNPSAQQVSQTPFCIYCTVYIAVEFDSAPSTLSYCALYVYACSGVRLSIFYAESLCLVQYISGCGILTEFVGSSSVHQP